jgi:1-phosphofructokinase family hexose kinase
MKRRYNSIITVGISPCWDITALAKNPQWGDHVPVVSATSKPAGKALNVSRALAWMKTPSIAAGLWGALDYQEMISDLAVLKPYLTQRFTRVTGRTRQNITICDTAGSREIHLRAPCSLVSPDPLRQLRGDLERIVKPKSFCLFAGSMGQGRFDTEMIRLLKWCNRQKAHVALDSSGSSLKAAVKQGGLWLIKPNLSELSELLGHTVKDRVKDILHAAEPLLDQVDLILVSRGKRGAILISRQCTIAGKCEKSNEKVMSTVACGDYLLAGFLNAIRQGQQNQVALRWGLQAATAKCRGWTDRQSWSQTKQNIPIILTQSPND